MTTTKPTPEPKPVPTAKPDNDTRRCPSCGRIMTGFSCRDCDHDHDHENHY